MTYDILNKINSPCDLKALPADRIEPLCKEIREFLISNVERSGGHLASNLGAVELSVAIHRVFDSPTDHIIFDVGHQSYVHKLLTGRRDRFDTLRTTGGLSGFTKTSESEHDAFGAGHSSTSVSAALGFAEADRLAGSDAYSVAVLGDGAYTGGMVHEALNNCKPDLKLVIILNENGMSISLNKGAFAKYLTRVRISKGYRVWKSGTRSFFGRIPLIGKAINATLTFCKKVIKTLFFSSNYFEDLGLYYLGPIDGNDYKKVEKALRRAKSLGECVIVHLKTQKGRGYEPAERSPDDFHSVYSKGETERSFHSEFSKKLIEIASEDEKVVGVTAAMGIGTGLDKFGAAYPDRYFDVGIAEGHALTFSAGLCAAGMKPYAAIYSTFLQRGYDSILHDIALQGLGVKLMIDRAGLAVGDGATHHGIFDVSFLSHVPGMTIYSPATYAALYAAMDEAKGMTTPVAIRYPNSSECEAVVREFYTDGHASIDGIRSTFDKSDTPEYVFITYGTLASRVLDAAKLVAAEGKHVGVLLVERLKPYGILADSITPFIENARSVLFAEEGIYSGGAGMNLREALFARNFDFTKTLYNVAAIDDNFASPDEVCELYDHVGLSPKKLAARILNGKNI